MENESRSPEIGKLALALSIAQGEITGARKESKNPFFKSTYADLASCWDCCRSSLSKNKLAVIQTTKPSEHGVIIVTTLVHESGQWIKGELLVDPVKKDPQGLGSAITYGRRYSLCAMVGIAQVDDDGNMASGRDKKPVHRAGKGASEIIKELDMAENIENLALKWQQLTDDIKTLSKSDYAKVSKHKDLIKAMFSGVAKKGENKEKHQAS
ncbi:MAG TPA: hypothetical protein EYP35_09805 [Desulfobacterales bacterium]|nr:hypothetical protein [Desulfobacterales bacterium]HIP38989.1 hypothetical protein [Desulfocapsa sulfexigens]